MALPGTGWLRQAWSARTVVELRDLSVMLNVTTQNHTQPWASGQVQQVTVPKPDWSYDSTNNEGVGAVTRARGGDWPTVADLDDGSVTFTRSGGYASYNRILWEDAGAFSWPAIEATRSRQTYAIANQIDTAIYTALKGGIASGDQTTLGTAGTNFISRTAPYTPSGTGASLVRAALDQFSIKASRKGVFTPDSQPIGSRWCVMPPELFGTFSTELLEEGFSWDVLTSDIMRNNSVLTAQGFQGRYKGIDIFSSNLEAVPTSSANWVFVCGMAEAYAAAVRAPLVQFFTPQENQLTVPGYVLRQAGDWGGAELDGTLLHQFTIHAD